MASLIHTVAAGSTKSDGTVNAGGRVFLYRPGTSSAVTAYTDRDKSASVTLSSGGYLLDSAGRAYLWVDEPCTVREETSAGTLIREYTGPEIAAQLVEVQNVGFTGTDSTGAQAAGGRTYLDALLTRAHTSFGGLDFKMRGTYGSTDRNINDELEETHLNVKRFGAIGNGVADDTPAFTTMINASAAGRTKMYVPAGTYRLTAALTLPTSARLVGDGFFGGTILMFESTTENGLNLGSAASVENLDIDHATSSSGVAINSTVGEARLDGVQITGFATAIAAAGSNFYAFRSVITGNTAATSGVATVRLYASTIGGGTTTATTNYSAETVDSGKLLFAAGTADMANGGNTTPVLGSVGQPIAVYRIRGTSAGGGTVNATSAPPIHTKVLFLDLFNNSGGAFLFTMNAQYHVSANPNPANGARIGLILVWESTGGFWVEYGGQTAVT